MWNDLRLMEQFGPYLDRRVGEMTLRDRMIGGLLKIRAKNGGVKYLKLNRAQREYSARAGRKNIVLKARQVGITTYIAARFFLQTITRPGTLTVQVAHSDESATAIFNIVHRFWERFPNARMQRGALVKSRSNTRQIVFPKLDSEYRVESADGQAGRGMTIHHLHCSEVSRWPRDGRETLASLRAAVVPGGEIVLESTPNGASGMFYEEWNQAEENGYTRHFFPWWYEPAYVAEIGPSLRELSEEEKAIMLRHGLSVEQIAWRRQQWREMKALGAQEFAEDPALCFLASGECVFDHDAIEKAILQAGPVWESRENGRILVWLPPNEKDWEYIIGVDTAGGGVDGDYACAQVITRKDGMQCAELRGHYPPQELARRVAELGRAYGDALVAVERNNQGHGVIAHLKDFGYTNLYEQGGQVGWLTSAATRPSMIDNLAEILDAKPNLFQSPRLFEEMKTFVRRADGQGAANDGAHDDCVMAMAVALAVRADDAGRIRNRVVGTASISVG